MPNSIPAIARTANVRPAIAPAPEPSQLRLMEKTYDTGCLAPTIQPTQQNLGTRWGCFITLGGDRPGFRHTSGRPQGYAPTFSGQGVGAVPCACPDPCGNALGFLYLSGGAIAGVPPPPWATTRVRPYPIPIPIRNS
ncbi:MAG: hypothetical protein JWS08_19940 [Phormidium sp. PBR-2020]|nr:MAG: hypothetical protein JWS08_19940 [Phormidium sp. PBR-2020]